MGEYVVALWNIALKPFLNNPYFSVQYRKIASSKLFSEMYYNIGKCTKIIYIAQHYVFIYLSNRMGKCMRKKFDAM